MVSEISQIQNDKDYVISLLFRTQRSWIHKGAERWLQVVKTGVWWEWGYVAVSKGWTKPADLLHKCWAQLVINIRCFKLARVDFKYFHHKKVYEVRDVLIWCIHSISKAYIKMSQNTINKNNDLSTLKLSLKWKSKISMYHF